jgi:hypothetical protein
MVLRNNYHQISYNTAVDEASIEPLLIGQGLRYLQTLVAIVFNRRKSRSDFAGNANYSYCASRDLKYFGYKLVTICTVNGLPVVYDLVPANHDERLAAEAVIDYLSFCDIFANKGFISLEWQTQIIDLTGNLIWAPRRSNQHYQNSICLDRWLSGVRERIESLFNVIQNTGCNIEQLLAKTVVGLCTRIIVKMTSYILRHLLLTDFGVEVQTLLVISTKI